jgi:hypothetical protein
VCVFPELRYKSALLHWCMSQIAVLEYIMLFDKGVTGIWDVTCPWYQLIMVF